MSLNLIQTPEVVSLVKNMVTFRLTTDNYITTEGAEATQQFGFSDLPEDGDHFTLTWGENQVAFTFSDAPDNSGTQLRIPDSLDPIPFNTSLAQDILSNYLFAQDFLVIILPGSPELNIIAKNTGSAYTIVVSDLSPVMIDSLNIPGVDQVTRPNFKVRFQIYTYSPIYGISNVYQMIWEGEEKPDRDNNVTFEISEYLKAELSYNPNVIGTGAPDTLCIKPYFIRYVESYGDVPQAVGKLIQSDDFYVIKGGVKKIDYPGFSFFGTWLPYNKKFLTWEPVTKIISKNQPEVLNYLVYDTSTSIKLSIQFFYSDGTSEYIYGDPITTSKYKVHSLNISYDLLSPMVDPSKVILKYKICLLNQSNSIISEFRTYVIDHKRNFERYFYYANSFGVFNCLRTYGAGTLSFNSEDVVSESDLSYNYELPESESKRSLVTSQDSVKVSTGYLPSIVWKKALQDFLRSDSIIEYKNGKLIPVTMLTKKDSSNENDSLYKIDFEYNYGYIDNAFSNANELI